MTEPEHAVIKAYLQRVFEHEQAARDKAYARIDDATEHPGLRELFRRQANETFDHRMLGAMRLCNISRRLCALFRLRNPEAAVSLQCLECMPLRLWIQIRVPRSSLSHPVEDAETCHAEYATRLCPEDASATKRDQFCAQMADDVAHIFATGDDASRDLF
jgi:hypothetical protein